MGMPRKQNPHNWLYPNLQNKWEGKKAASLLDTAPWIEDGIKDGQLTSLMITQQYFCFNYLIEKSRSAIIAI